MEMDRSWMYCSRSNIVFKGVKNFLNFAFNNGSSSGMILCPCRHCGNGICRTRDDVEAHLLWRGFKPGYYHWTTHGETSFKNDIGSHSLIANDVNDDMEGLLNDAFRFESNTTDE
ncbi:hypothetical protein MA16_Dca026607 [Dendrobium catenatum]|uniref:Transposase-associated domain-containing protein n=1 Tax=Dendrobium catenatum TaxID=906689 RepID=A0A2I0VH96_9ASPA|nr:hypothetical protein MA16_Dca026607 [Dendrobium catenatum]